MIKKLGIGVIAAVVILFMFQYVLLTAVAKNGIKHLVKLDTHIGSISVNPLRGRINIRGFKVMNPPGFKEKILISMPLIVMDSKAKTFFEPGAFFDKIEMHIDEVNIVRDKKGVVNLSKVPALASQDTPEKKKPFFVDRYIISVGKVVYLDMTQEKDKQVREIELNVNEEYKKLDNADSLINLIAYKIFFNGKIGNIGVDIQQIQKDLAARAKEDNSITQTIKDAINGRVQTVTDTVKAKRETG